METEVSFSEFTRQHVVAGQGKLSAMMQVLVHNAEPALFERLDASNDAVFLEPLLFAYFTAKEPRPPLGQLLFGSIPEAARPEEVRVWANRRGVIELPGIGYLLTRTSGPLDLVWTGSVDACYLKDGFGLVEHVFCEPLRLDGVPVEICRYGNPLLDRLFLNEGGQAVAVEIEGVAPAHLEHLATAFGIIARHDPDYFREVLRVTRKIVLFAGEPSSFTALSAHGMVFVNTRETDDEVFFVEDLVHQCGHLVFSALTLEMQDFLAIEAEVPLRLLTCDAREARTVYDAFHGVFTEAHMNQCLDLCLENRVFAGRQAHELAGRLAYILKRSSWDLGNLCRPEIFTPKGLLLMGWFAQVYNGIIQRRAALLSALDTSNQPYAFSYTKFLELNPDG